MNAEEIIARLIDSKAINGEEAVCLLQNITPKEVFVPFNQVKEFGPQGNPYSPVYPQPSFDGTITTGASTDVNNEEVFFDAWVARDKNNVLYLFNDKPFKRDVEWACGIRGSAMLIESKFFPEVKWEDDKPTKVKLIIKKV